MNLTSLQPRHRRRSFAGFTLIEVLVALIIFSFGMLGLAGLQIRMLSYSQSSLKRSQAAALTADILDRMRVDRPNALSGEWNTEYGQSAQSLPDGTNASQYDLKDWKTELEAQLPDAQARVEAGDDGSGNANVTVIIRWRDSRGTDLSNPDGVEEFVTRSRL